MELNKTENPIIGLSFNINVVLDNNKENIRDVYEKFEDYMLNYIDEQKNIIFINGKCDFIREKNNLGIKIVK